MVLINIPTKELLQKLVDELEVKYSIKLARRRFYGFKVSVGSLPVTIVSDQNLMYVAWRIAKDSKLEVIELFHNNSCQWVLERLQKD